MGEVAEQVGRFVNAYSGDLRDETLDGQRVVVGGIVTAQRTVITKRQETMAIVTLEDLQGSIEVVVFPRLFETTRPLLRDGAILLIAGRVDHKGEEVSLLADLVADWDDAARPRTRGIRARRGRRRPQRPERFVPADAGRRRAGPAVAAGRAGSTAFGGAAVGGTAVAAPATPPSSRRDATTVAAGPPEALPHIAPAEPVPTYLAAPGAPRRSRSTTCPRSRPCPTRRARGSSATRRPTPRFPRGPGAVLHVRFERYGGPGPARPCDGDRQAAAARSARWDEGRAARPGVRRRSGAADGAARGRRLRRGAARGGPPAAGRRSGRDAARRHLGVRPGTTRLGGQPAGSMPITVAAHGQ